MTELQQAVYNVLQDYAQEVENLLRQKLQQKKLVNTQELLKSIATQVTAQTDVAEMELAFWEYGRFQDMQNTERFSQPPVNKSSDKWTILQWVEKKGVENFKTVPGYLNSRPTDARKAATRIAWAISKAILKNNNQRRRRAWYAKTFWSTLPKLTATLLDALTEEQIKQLQQL